MPELTRRSTARKRRRAPPTDPTPDMDLLQSRYRVRFARTSEDLDRALRLRFEVFNLELGEGLAESFGTGRDVDRFDSQCQHLLVVHEPSGETIGTYRLQVAETAEIREGWYTAGEFDFGHLPRRVLDEGVELGRACIRDDHRNREVLFLLWKGLAAYVLWNEKRYFFGCSSLTSTDPSEGLRAYRQLAETGFVHPEISVPPLPGYACGPAYATADPIPPGPDVKIPTLFRTYLRFGAKVLGPPALDRAFSTVDFLTLLDVAAMDPRTFALFSP